MNEVSALARTVGTRIRAVRNAAHLSRSDLATKAGVSFATVSMIEDGNRAPSLTMVETLAAALGVSPWALLRPPAPCGVCAGRRPRPGFLCTGCGAGA